MIDGLEFVVIEKKCTYLLLVMFRALSPLSWKATKFPSASWRLSTEFWRFSRRYLAAEPEFSLFFYLHDLLNELTSHTENGDNHYDADERAHRNQGQEPPLGVERLFGDRLGHVQLLRVDARLANSQLVTGEHAEHVETSRLEVVVRDLSAVTKSVRDLNLVFFFICTTYWMSLPVTQRMAIITTTQTNAPIATKAKNHHLV